MFLLLRLALFTPVEQYECGWCEVMKYLHYVDKRLVRAKSVSSTMRRERQLKCTIWDDHVDAMLPYFNSTEPEPVIVLIQLCRAKTVNGEVIITSSYDATKLWFNHYCPEFTEFKAKLTKENTPMKSISTNSMVSQTTDIRDFISGSVVITTISDLYQQTEEVVDVPTELESLIGGDEVNSPNNIIKPRQQEVEQEMSPLSKRSLLDQFSSTQQMKKGRLEVIKKEKIV
nr:replication factor A protein 1-like [Ipomoea batatas]